MRLHMRAGFGLTALAVTLAPIGAVPLTTSVAETAAHPQPSAQASAAVSTAPLSAPVAAALQTSGRTSRFAPAPPPQDIEPQTVIDGRILPGDHRKIRVDTPKGEHVWTASALLDHDLPAAALRAYKTAAATQDAQDPSCRLPWSLLAGIGRVESDHGRYGGSVLGSDGISRPAILGIPLNGVGPVAAIADTDGGRWDGDTVWDRAVGPMQFIPSTWASSGRDGDGDGVKSPNDLNDAALAAAGYLCAGSGSVSTDAGMRAAVFRYNPSSYYVSLVTAFARGYQTGAFVIPSPPAPKDQAGKPGTAKSAKAKAKAKAKATTAKKGAKPSAKAKAKAKAKATRAATSPRSASKPPTKSPTPKPSPPPSNPPPSNPPPSDPPPSAPPPSDPPPSTAPLETITGELAGGPGSWTVAGRSVDFSKASQAVTDSLSGLVGTSVTVEVDSAGVVQTLNGQPVAG